MGGFGHREGVKRLAPSHFVKSMLAEKSAEHLEEEGNDTPFKIYKEHEDTKKIQKENREKE
jgi:hypothetical protein